MMTFRSVRFVYFAVAVFFALTPPSIAQNAKGTHSLRPLMNQSGKVVFRSDFETDGPLEKQDWQSRQGTQWRVVEGVLRGHPSSDEYQTKKKDHKGLEPRIASLKTPKNFLVKLSFRFIGGEETTLLPIVEFGHHKVRLKFSESKVQLLADHESLQLVESSEVGIQRGQWHHILAEQNGDQFVVQFADGPTITGKHESYAAPISSGADGLGIAGTRFGTVEIDNVIIAEAGGVLSSWESTRKTLPKMNPIPTPAKKSKKKDKKSK